MKNKKIQVIKTANLYKWNKNYKRVQDRFFENKYKVRRIQNIEDFVKLNNFKKVFHDEEVWLDLAIPETAIINDADLILVTHQGYGRYPLSGIIKQINKWLDICPSLYLCLNRHYLNIDNQQIDLDLPDDYQQAITSWLQQSLTANVVDLSRDYIDDGAWFSWSVPDRQYFITKRS